MLNPAQRSAQRFADNPLWREALWLATTFRWHPQSEAPPVMGIVFSEPGKGVELFRGWIDDWGNADEEDDIRVAVIEGEIAGQAAGYTVRISPAHQAEPGADVASRTAGQVQRMHPIMEVPDMLSRFKQEYLRHGEFLLAPVIERDGQLWFDVEHGIVKRRIELRWVSDIHADDLDAVALHTSDDVQPPI